MLVIGIILAFFGLFYGILNVFSNKVANNALYEQAGAASRVGIMIGMAIPFAVAIVGIIMVVRSRRH